MTRAQRSEVQTEALTRAVQSPSVVNYPAIFAGFIDRGIPESEIRPRENVFTYHAWRAIGRQVRKGEKGVQVTTWIPLTSTDKTTGERKITGRRPKTAYVFHETQTDPIAGHPIQTTEEPRQITESEADEGSDNYAGL
jgi:hypothetical protein